MKRIIILGAGIIGCTLAYTLSKYDLDITVIEKSSYVGSGATKANSAMLHEGLSTNPDSLRGKLVVGAKKRICELCARLGVPYTEEAGLITLAFEAADFDGLRATVADAERLGLHGEILTKEETLQLEPHANPNILGSFYSKSVGTVSPYELAIALAEVAAVNGVRFAFHAYPIAISETDHAVCCTLNDGQILEADLIFNATGVHTDDIAALVGDTSFSIHPRRGEYVLYDQEIFNLVSHIISVPGNKLSKGMILVPLDHGNLLAGSSAENIQEKEALQTTGTMLETIYHAAISRMVPAIPQKKHIITNFSGIRAVSNTNDYVIGFSPETSRLFHFAGIQSPGLTSCMNIVDYGLEMVESAWPGFFGNKRSDWVERRLSGEPTTVKAGSDRIVCRCEGVTDQQIRQSIHAPIPCTTLDALKRRLRTGMGICQGGHCSNRVAQILSEETGIAVEEVLKDLPGSNYIR